MAEEEESLGSDLKNATPLALEKHGITLGKTLGSGSYSKVKFGTATCGDVAVKIVDLQKVSRNTASKNIPREIECLKILCHPNVIRYILHVQTPYRMYIVMEFAENGCVLDYLKSKNQISEGRSRRWFKQLLDAVSYCHGKGVVHRDIKCENLLLGRDDIIKLADFGFGRPHIKETETSQTYCGSPIYTAPEVLLEAPYVPHYSDIWSMGVVLFCFLYRRLPFSDQGYRRVVLQAQCKVAFPKSIVVSSTCKHLIEKMIAPLRRRCYLPELRIDPWVVNGPPPSRVNSVNMKTLYLPFNKRTNNKPEK